MAGPGGPQGWGQRLPPLASVLVALALAALVLPSSLNTTLPDPPQTLEFAPVPPDSDEPPPPDAQGDVGDLGLGSSSTLPGGEAGPGPGGGPTAPPPPPPPRGIGTTPLTKRCVGAPPRQTEDPLSPPCVGYFDGDNGGATAPGVTANDIRVVWYFNGGTDTRGQAGTSRGFEPGPANTVVDLSTAPEDDEYVWVRVLRPYVRYFNDRYQTYGRTVRGWAQFGDPAETVETRRADATVALAEIDPFAIVIGAGSVNNNIDAYIEAALDAGVMVFLASDGFAAVGLAESTYAARSGLLWSYQPSLERRIDIVTSYVCSQVVGHPVSFGQEAPPGSPRKLGIVRMDDPDRPDMSRWADLIEADIRACGGDVETVVSYGGSGTNAERQDVLANIAELDTAEVTTVIWVGTNNKLHSEAAAAIDYLPEWMIIGDGVADITSNAQIASQRVMQHARAVTLYTLQPPVDRRLCLQAAVEAAPQTNRNDIAQFGCRLYPDARQLFIGIQVAGPRLTSASVDQGFHAIPDGPSGDPTVPACFYDPGDFTCVKDATAAWWDPAGQNTNGTTGCWRLYEGGRRYLAGAWPVVDVDARRTADDPCSILGFHPAPG